MLKKALKQGKLKLWSKYVDELRKDHILNYLFWECTLNCNFFCKHCGSSAGRKFFPGQLSTAEIKNTFKSIAEDFNPQKIMVAITGGEPLLRTDLFEVMGYANSLGFPWGMVTNGFLLNSEKTKKLKGAGMSTVVVSIDGIGVDHDEFRQAKGAYEKAINAINLLAKERFLEKIQITTSVHRGNVLSLEKMYQEFIKLPITSWRVMNVDPIGRAEQDKNLIINDDQFQTMMKFIKEKRKKAPFDVTYGCDGYLGLDYEGEVRANFFYCATGINVGTVLYNGDIFVCPNVPRRKELIQGNVKTDRFSEVWNNKFQQFRDKNRTKCDKCAECLYWDECLGNGFHLWDFDKKEPKLCHMKMLDEI